LNIKKRAAGLVAAAGLVTGLFAVGAPSAHAVQLAQCQGFNFFGTIVPPLAGDGSLPPTGVSNVATMKSGKAGTVVWLPGFGAAVDPVNGAAVVLPGIAPNVSTGSCTFHLPTGDVTDPTSVVSAKLSGRATCNTASTDPSQYPLNGKVTITNVLKTFKESIYVRVAGFDTSVGPDIVSLTGIDTKGSMPGATISGEVGFDPVVKNLATFTAPTLTGNVQILKNQYYFDNTQVTAPCGGPGGTAIGLIYGTDTTSLLGNPGQPLSLDI